MLISSVQILVDNGFLGIPELSKLLLLSSKFHDATLHDNIYMGFLVPSGFSQHQIHPGKPPVSRGYFWWYTRTQWKSAIAEQRPLRPLPPPQCTANDIDLNIHLKHKGNPLVSVPVYGKFMNTLATEGSIDLTLAEAFLGKADWRNFTADEVTKYKEGKLEKLLEAFWNGNDGQEFDVSIHLFRTRTRRSHASFGLLQEPECLENIMVLPKPGKTLTPESEFDLSE